MLWPANDGRNLTVVERVHYGLFFRPHYFWSGWILGEILRLETSWIWRWELVFLRHCHRWTAVVSGKDKFIVTGASGTTVVAMLETAIGFLSNFVRKSQEGVLVALIRRLHRSCRGTLRFSVLWLWRCLSVQRFFRQLLTVFFLALWFVKFFSLSSGLVPSTTISVILLMVFSPIGWLLNQMFSFNFRFRLTLR